MKDLEKINVFWFRRDLRLEDNHGLFRALSSGVPVLPVFIFDPNEWGTEEESSALRKTFVMQALTALHRQLNTANSALLVFNEPPLDVFARLVQTFDVRGVYVNREYEPYGVRRDSDVSNFLRGKGISLHDFKDHLVFEKNEILKSDGTPYTVYTPYAKQWKLKLSDSSFTEFPSESALNGLLTKPVFPAECDAWAFKPSVQELDVVIPMEIILHYGETRDIPALKGTSALGAHLRYGTVSIRRLVKIASELNETWLNELIWREFFSMISWHYPKVVTESFKSKYDRIVWRNNEAEFEKWCKGETGYPMVDAGMRQLLATGWMHNRVRMVVASFLTKHLLIDWRWGEAYFAHTLVDYDLASNNGNWQWAAGCGCDAAPYFRIFNPHEQCRKFDPELNYVKTWIPNYAPGYLPEIVEHAFARNRALETFKKALQ